MKTVKVRIAFTEECLGTAAANPELYREFIASNRPEGVSTDEVDSLPSVDDELAKRSGVLQRQSIDRHSKGNAKLGHAKAMQSNAKHGEAMQRSAKAWPGQAWPGAAKRRQSESPDFPKALTFGKLHSRCVPSRRRVNPARRFFILHLIPD
jgi:hypothetical protein